MTSFNKDYSAVESQMKTIRKYLSQCSNSFQIYDGIELYRALGDCIGVPEKKQYSVFSFQEAVEYDEEKSKITNQLTADFQKESLFHQDFFASSYRIMKKLQKKVEDDIPYIDSEDYTPLGNDKEKELLDAFLEEEDPVLRDIYHDMLRQKQIYRVKQDEDPSAVYNRLEAIPNIFIPKQHSTIVKLGDIIHELGHIYDEMNLREKDSRNEYSYSYFSLYKEVFSYYYEQKFLYFLIGNDIYKVEAQNELLNKLDILVDDLRTMKNTFRSTDYDSYQLHSDIQYSYGPIISNFIMDFDKEKQAFQSFRHEPFSSSKLEMIGASGKNAATTMVKKLKTYFKS